MTIALPAEDVAPHDPAAGAALAAAEADWIALDAARLEELPPGANVVIASDAWTTFTEPRSRIGHSPVSVN